MGFEILLEKIGKNFALLLVVPFNLFSSFNFVAFKTNEASMTRNYSKVRHGAVVKTFYVNILIYNRIFKKQKLNFI